MQASYYPLKTFQLVGTEFFFFSLLEVLPCVSQSAATWLPTVKAASAAVTCRLEVSLTGGSEDGCWWAVQVPGPVGLCNTGHKGRERKGTAALLAHGGKYSLAKCALLLSASAFCCQVTGILLQLWYSLFFRHSVHCAVALCYTQKTIKSPMYFKALICISNNKQDVSSHKCLLDSSR